MPDHVLESGDSPDLEALFDSIAVQNLDASSSNISSTPAVDRLVVLDPADIPSNMYSQIGHLARKLHDTVRELGYDKSLERVTDTIPDAKDRLNYIATLTANAADRVLNATDIAKPIQDDIESGAQALSARWEKLFANQLSVEEFQALAQETRQYLGNVPNQTQATSTQLLEIVMAQDFQDLTGQVIKKILEMVKSLEGELLNFLIDYSPSEKRAELDPSLLNGPVINPEGRSDIVTSQSQVDDLLESLGF